jgi:hypothetical protein
MELSIRSLKPDDIQVWDDGWGGDKPEGIRFGNVSIWLSDAALDALSVVVTMLQTERAIAQAEEEKNLTRDCEDQVGDWAGSSTLGLPKWVA